MIPMGAVGLNMSGWPGGLNASQRDGLASTPHAVSTCELDLEIIAFRFSNIHPEGVESPPGFLFVSVF
jgi:hypothetical protein